MFFGKLSSVHFKIRLFVFLLLSELFCYLLMSFLCILDINLLSDIWCTNIFSHATGRLFILLMVYVAVQKLCGP